MPNVDPLVLAMHDFEALRIRVMHQSGSPTGFPQLREPELKLQEAAMQAEVLALHRRLPEQDRLGLYRFYMTAVHRDSVLTRRISIAARSADRSAALEAEFRSISEELDDLVDAFAQRVPNSYEDVGDLLAQDFCWSLVWWIHARPEVLSFVFRPGDDATLLLLLGRRPSTHQHTCSELYAQAGSAERTYRQRLTTSVGEPTQAARAVGGHI